MNIRFEYRTGRNYDIYYKHLTDKVKTLVGNIFAGTISMVSVLNIGCSFVGENNTGRAILFGFQLALFGLLILWNRKFKEQVHLLIEDAIVRRSYHERIAEQLTGVEWKVIEPGNQCIGLSRDGEHFLVYFYVKADIRYRLMVFQKGWGDEYFAHAVIRLNHLVPLTLYNPAVFSLIGQNDEYMFNDMLPTNNSRYSDHIRTMSRRHTIDDILADLS